MPGKLIDTFKVGPRNLQTLFFFFTLSLKPQECFSLALIPPDKSTVVECLLVMPQAMRTRGTEKSICFIALLLETFHLLYP